MHKAVETGAAAASHKTLDCKDKGERDQDIVPKAFRSSSRTAEVNFRMRHRVVTTANSRL